VGNVQVVSVKDKETYDCALVGKMSDNAPVKSISLRPTT
jgi:hypothetical protein